MKLRQLNALIFGTEIEETAASRLRLGLPPHRRNAPKRLPPHRRNAPKRFIQVIFCRQTKQSVNPQMQKFSQY